MTQSILVVAAHSDDEALGCGGTIAKHTLAGDQVHLVFLTNGVGARNAKLSESEDRESSAHTAARILGVTSLTQLSFPDNQLDSIPLLDVVQAIENIALPLEPSIVYTHHCGDLNVDHRICNQAVLTAFRPVPGQSVRAIYGFEVASSTEWAFGSQSQFQPQLFVDITATLDTKIKALAAYQDEMRSFPHARSNEAILALAKWRGANIGCKAAEAFGVIRKIVQ